MSIRDWPIADQPREKLWRGQSVLLSDAELIAILLRTGYAPRQESAVDVARRLLHQWGSIDQICNSSVQKLASIKGVGMVKAVTLHAALQLSQRLQQLPMRPALPLNNSDKIYARYRQYAQEAVEKVWLLSLSARHHVLHESLIAQGDVHGAGFYPRAVLAEALRRQAASIVLLHNHPSGDPRPSPEDLQATRRLVDAAQCVGLRVLDHIIIAHDGHFSFADAGLLPVHNQRS